MPPKKGAPRKTAKAPDSPKEVIAKVEEPIVATKATEEIPQSRTKAVKSSSLTFDRVEELATNLWSSAVSIYSMLSLCAEANHSYLVG
jgi:hypothetical protein